MFRPWTFYIEGIINKTQNKHHFFGEWFKVKGKTDLVQFCTTRDKWRLLRVSARFAKKEKEWRVSSPEKRAFLYFFFQKWKQWQISFYHNILSTKSLPNPCSKLPNSKKKLEVVMQTLHVKLFFLKTGRTTNCIPI